MPKKIIEEAIEEVKEEATETVGTVTFKRWQVAVAAAILTIVLLGVII